MLTRPPHLGLARLRRAATPVLLPAAAVLALVTGVLPLPDAVQVLHRVWPVLGFLVAVTAVAELADRAGVFELAADLAVRAGRGRVRLLWLLVVVLATATTVLLSLDVTAVLLTPVVLAVAQRLRLPAAPFALTTVWLANTGSLLLPVSNLTNLLAVERTGWTAAQWARWLAVPAVGCVVVTVAVLWLLFRRELRGRYPSLPPRPVRHPLLLTLAAGACLGLGAAVALGVPPWIAGAAAAVVLVAGFAVADRAGITPAVMPGRLLLGTVAIFLLVAAAERHGISALLHTAAGTARRATGASPAGDPAGIDLPDAVRVAGVGAVASNAVNNLPAYLAVEPAVAGRPERLLALVIGTNAGPLVTPWACLATLLWRERCRARDVEIPALRSCWYGLLAAVPVLGVGVVALVLAG